MLIHLIEKLEFQIKNSKAKDVCETKNDNENIKRNTVGKKKE